MKNHHDSNNSTNNRSNTRKQIIAIAIIIAAATFPAMRAGGESPKRAVVVESGKAECVIALPEAAGDAEKYAAGELAEHIEKMSGAAMEILPETAAADRCAILVGATKRGAEIIADSELAPLGREGFVIRERAGDVAVRGGSQRGTLFGAYSLLEDRLGVRWFAPDTMRIPKMSTIDLTGLNISQKPAFEYREPYFASEYDGPWAARNRVRLRGVKIDRDAAADVTYAGFVHTLASLVPADKYFKDHPEYFSQVNGERIPDGQTCLTSPGALEVAKQNVLKIAAESGGRPVIISVSQNDNFRRCTCPKCLAVDEEEGSPAGTMLRFVNAIAAAVADKYPNVAIDTLAYQYTEKVPKITKPLPNVIVRLCHMAPSCEIHPLGKCMWNKGYISNLNAWNKISDRLYIWDYVVDFSHYAMPLPNLDAVIADIPYHAKRGVKGMFQQGDPAPGADLGRLKAWVIAKLLWDPEADGNALIDEFLRGYYGPAAPAMRKYIDVQLAHARKMKQPVNLYSHPTAGHLTPEVLDGIKTAIDEAEKLAAAEPLYAEHVREARLSYTYAILAAPELFEKTRTGRPTRDQLLKTLDQFTAELQHFGVPNLAELESTQTTLDKLRKRIEGYSEQKN